MTIDPYSMAFQAPEQRLAKLMQILTQVFLPAMPLMQQQGIQFDFKELIKITSKYSNLPELERILKFTGQKAQEEGGSKDDARQSPVTSRTTSRVNSSEGDGMDSVIQQLMSAAGDGGADAGAGIDLGRGFSVR